MATCVTGHRPDKLGGYSLKAHKKVYEVASFIVTKNIPEVNLPIYTGMALGWDTAIANVCADNNIPFVACIPFVGQERKWPSYQQEVYLKLLDCAQEVINISGKDYYDPWFMQLRNEWMVDHSRYVLALWNGSEGGTANTVRYAQLVGKKIINMWPLYEMILKGDLK